MVRRAFFLLVSLAGCAAQTHGEPAPAEPAELITPRQLFAAWDGVHSYMLAPWVPKADPSSSASESVDPKSIMWEADSAFLSERAYLELPGGLVITTLRAGTTEIRVSARTRAGRQVEDSVPVEITQALPEQWTVGDLAYRGENPAHGFRMGAVKGNCGALDFFGGNECVLCHAPGNSIGSPSLERVQRFSNDVLAQIFSEGLEAEGFTPNPAWAAQVPQNPSCILQSSHTWQIAEDIKLGLVFKVRSLALP
jgi:hypothetical protein